MAFLRPFYPRVTSFLRAGTVTCKTGRNLRVLWRRQDELDSLNRVPYQMSVVASATDVIKQHVKRFSAAPAAGVAEVPEKDVKTEKPGFPGNKKSEVTYDELVGFVAKGSLHLFDVREPNEVQETGMIPHAVNIPLTKLKSSLQLEGSEFEIEVKVVKPLKDSTDIVFYGLCAVKSTSAVEIAHKLGFKKARYYPGGWEEWSQKQKH